MDILSRLSLNNEWEAYYSYKTEKGSLSDKEREDLRSFIDNREYVSVVENIKSSSGFNPPKKTLINKSKVGKKRSVYTYNREENYVLKLITFLLKDYDNIFSPNLYSFRKNRGVKRATKDILRIKDINSRYVYKVDIKDYFNSVDVDILLPKLKKCFEKDLPLYGFIKNLLKNQSVKFNDKLIEEKKGIMAGTPISTFLANLYLSEMDFYFYENKISYMRYSDDIIIFSKNKEELEASIDIIRSFLAENNLKVNEEKEVVTLPYQEWTFLGFSYNCGVIDVSKVSFEKLKAKMKRKTRALLRWADKKGISGDKTARVFIKRFNTKLYDNPIDSELTWTRWFFPVINTDKTLKQIDEYMLECIRYLATGKRTKSKYNFKYKDIKALGYRSLVNEYFKQISVSDNNKEMV